MNTLRRTVSETSLWQREGAMTPLRRLYMQEHWNAGIALLTIGMVFLQPNNILGNNALGPFFFQKIYLLIMS